MEMLCPECMAPLVISNGRTACCPNHPSQFEILFTRQQAPGVAPAGGAPVFSPPTPGAAPFNPPPLPGGNPAPAFFCQNHSEVQAILRCTGCGAGVCPTCDFAFPGNVHLCPACATNPRPQIAPGRKKTMWWAMGLNVWNTIGLVLMFAGVFAKAHATKADRDAMGGLITVGFIIPSLIGIGLGIASMERRQRNPPIAWIACIWSIAICAVYLLLIIVGLSMGGR